MRSVAEVFDIRSDGKNGVPAGEGGTFVVDEATGAFMAYTTFGTFAYSWPNRGDKSLKEFLASLSYDYFMGKASPDGGREFDVEATAAAIQDLLGERLAEHAITPHEHDKGQIRARQLKEATSEEKFLELYTSGLSGKSLETLVDAGPWRDIRMSRVNDQCLAFWEKLWPAFVEEAKLAPATAAPRLVVTVSGGVASVVTSDGPVDVAVIDMDREGSFLTQEDIDAITSFDRVDGNSEGVNKVLDDAREDLAEYLAPDGVTP